VTAWRGVGSVTGQGVWACVEGNRPALVYGAAEERHTPCWGIESATLASCDSGAHVWNHPSPESESEESESELVLLSDEPDDDESACAAR
jgi:hypothetical protein